MPDFQLKQLKPQAVPKAIEKARHYRLLNEPWEAQSICRDVLAIDPANQDALVTLVLALTDQFDRPGRPAEQARQLLPQLSGEYERSYYEGIICERHAKARWRVGVPPHLVQQELRDAMQCYERAEGQSPPGQDDALLRWNTCVRMIEHLDELAPPPATPAVTADFGDGPPLEGG
jgi:hypothetical protein